jgi:NAD(P)-dependent dehydrogenase (short-subunit alcohol dehydrogenase family)
MMLQTPIDSGFGAHSTAADVISGIDLSGKTALVTGGYSGLGLETVRALVAAGARVIVAARRPETAASDLSGIEGVTILPLDLADPASIDVFAELVAATTDRIHILINNAAIMACPLARDARGYEIQFATNHLGHFQMTARLWPLLVAGGADGGARIVSVSSCGHMGSDIHFDDPNYLSRDYDKWAAYGQAKTANALFAVELDRIGEAHGIRAFSLHPGGIRTPLQRSLTMEEMTAMGWYDSDGNLSDIFKSVEQGAATSIWCATSPQLDGMGGLYCEDCDVAPAWHEGLPRYTGVRAYAVDPDSAQRLWAMSEAMTGVSFPG